MRVHAIIAKQKRKSNPAIIKSVMTLTRATLIALGLKMFQLINAFCITRLLGTNDSSILLIIAGTIAGLFIIGLLMKRFVKSVPLASLWPIAVLALGGVFFINPIWTVFGLSSIFFYMFVLTEGQTLRFLNTNVKLPQAAPILLALIPFALTYLLPAEFVGGSRMLYVVSVALSLLGSYSSTLTTSREEVVLYTEAPSAWMGVLFFGLVGTFYYFLAYKTGQPLPLALSAFLLPFYCAGVMIVYTALDAYVRKACGKSLYDYKREV
jgi:hypothetical protein